MPDFPRPGTTVHPSVPMDAESSSKGLVETCNTVLNTLFTAEADQRAALLSQFTFAIVPFSKGNRTYRDGAVHVQCQGAPPGPKVVLLRHVVLLRITPVGENQRSILQPFYRSTGTSVSTAKANKYYPFEGLHPYFGFIKTSASLPHINAILPVANFDTLPAIDSLIHGSAFKSCGVLAASFWLSEKYSSADIGSLVDMKAFEEQKKKKFKMPHISLKKVAKEEVDGPCPLPLDDEGVNKFLLKHWKDFGYLAISGASEDTLASYKKQSIAVYTNLEQQLYQKFPNPHHYEDKLFAQLSATPFSSLPNARALDLPVCVCLPAVVMQHFCPHVPPAVLEMVTELLRAAFLTFVPRGTLTRATLETALPGLPLGIVLVCLRACA